MESTSEAFQHGTHYEKERHELYVTPVQQKQGNMVKELDFIPVPESKEERRKNRTRARIHPCTMKQGGRTVQELDFIPV